MVVRSKLYFYVVIFFPIMLLIFLIILFKIYMQFRSSITRLWKFLTVFSTIDWFVMKILFDFGNAVQYTFRQNLEDINEINQSKDQNVYLDHILKSETQSLVEVDLPYLPWLEVIHYWRLDSANASELVKEQQQWQRNKDRFPSYYDMVKKIRSMASKKDGNDSTLKDGLISNCIAYSNSWNLFYHFYSSIGYQHWKRVAINYAVFALTSAGIWTDYATEGFGIFPKFTHFQRIASSGRNDINNDEISSRIDFISARRRNSIDIAQKRMHNSSSDGTRPTMTPEELMRKNEHQNTFSQFLSATVSSRAILLQLIPGMTAPALLFVGLSSCPIFVFSAKLRENLTPLILWDAWTLASQRIIQVPSVSGKPATWKVVLLSCWLFVRDSRLIQYVEVVLLNLVALGVVFFPLQSNVLGIILLFISGIRGMMRFFPSLVSMHDFFFHFDGIATSEELLDEMDRQGRLSTGSVNITLDHIYDDFDRDEVDNNIVDHSAFARMHGFERRSSFSERPNRHRHRNHDGDVVEPDVNLVTTSKNTNNSSSKRRSSSDASHAVERVNPLRANSRFR